MNIVSKSFFILFSFLCVYPYSSVLCMQRYDLKYPQYKLTVLKRPTIQNRGLVKAEKDKLFLGFVWAKETFTRETHLSEDYKTIYYPKQNIRTEWCKKTYALLGTLFVGTAIGTAYYFDWFKKK